MKKLSFFVILLSVLSFSVSAQCVFETVNTDDFEYDTNISGLISGTVFHLAPKSYKPAHSPTRYCYMNFVNGLPVNTLVFSRTYNACIGSEYQFSAWFNEINGGTSSYKLQVKDSNDSLLFTSLQTSNSTSWSQWTSVTFTASTSTLKFQLVYQGGMGNNDLAMDDLKLERCKIDPFQSDSINVCISSAVNLIDSLMYPSGYGGSWTGPSTLLNDSLGTFVAGNMLAGVYTYSITSSSACPDSIGHITVDVDTVNTDVSVLTYVLTAAASNASYQWINCSNNQAILGETGQSFTAITNGSYSVEVTQNGCSDTSSCFQIEGIGLFEDGIPDLNYHPNPTSGKINLDFGCEYKSISIVVMNKMGQTIEKHQAKNLSRMNIDLSHLASDIYYLEIQTDNKRQIVKVLRSK